MTTTSAFSSSGEDAINQIIDINLPKISIPVTEEDCRLLEEIYDVKWTAEEIIAGEYSRIALQFPDELLCVSVPIFQCLKKRLPLETSLYVLADTSYGSCCVDEVTAQHVNADLIVHYGYSCLSTPSKLPVLFVFPKGQIDIKSTVNSLLDALLSQQDLTSHVILIPDVSYAHVSDTLYNELQSSQRLPPNLTVLFTTIPRRSSPIQQDDILSIRNDSATQISPHRRYMLPETVPLSSCIILYVGKESLELSNLLMTHPSNTIISYDPSAPCSRSSGGAMIESVRSNKLLMRRYAIVQRARDADIFGILVGTLGVASYLPLISHIRDLIRRCKKKFYTITVGKLNPAKLANFADIECFVMVACPENSVVESKEFYRPIITPFELYLALDDEPVWPGSYILDFENLIELQKDDATEGEQDTINNEKDPDRPRFSLTTGKYRYVKRYEVDSESTGGQGGGSSSSDLVLRNADSALTNLVSNVGLGFLHQKTFKGLEQRLGQDPPSALRQGRSGIAKDYNEQL